MRSSGRVRRSNGAAQSGLLPPPVRELVNREQGMGNEFPAPSSLFTSLSRAR